MGITSSPSRSAIPADRPPAPDPVPRRRILRALVRGNLAGRATALSVSRLGAMRWHIRLAPSENGRRREIYLSPDDGGLLFATSADGRLDVRLDGTLTEDCLRNLGDCLIQALCEEARHISLWLGPTEAASPGACSLFESLGRQLARERVRRRLDIHGQGHGATALTEAFRHGFARIVGSGDAA